MRYLAAIGVASALAAGGVGLAAADGAARSKAVLRVVDASPMTVRGERFTPSTAVTVTAVLRIGESQKLRREITRTRTGRRGGFTAELPRVSAHVCGLLAVTATDRAGRRATIKFAQTCGRAKP